MKAFMSIAAGVVLGLLGSHPAFATGFQPPEECKAYTGDAHLNCLYAYIELQKNQLGKIQDQLNAQQNSIGELRDRVERGQAAPLERAAPVPPQKEYVPVHTPPVYGSPLYSPYYYGYPYYPGAGLSFYLGPGYYGPRFFGPRYFYGPRFFGPRFHGHFRR